MWFHAEGAKGMGACRVGEALAEGAEKVWHGASLRALRRDVRSGTGVGALRPLRGRFLPGPAKKQIPCGDGNKKGKSNSKGKGKSKGMG